MAAPFGPPPRSATGFTLPSGPTQVSAPPAISTTSTEPSGRATGPSGNRRPSATTRISGENSRMRSVTLAVDEVPGGADDGVGVDPEVAVQIIDVAGLAEARHTEAGDGAAVDPGQERQRVGMPVEDGHDRCGAPNGEEAVEDTVVAGLEPLAGLQRSEDEVGRRQTDDVDGHAVAGETIGGGEDLGEHRPHADEADRRVPGGPPEGVAAGHDVAAALLPPRRVGGHGGEALVDRAGGEPEVRRGPAGPAQPGEGG